MKGTVAITTLGCKTNRFESAAMEEQLLGAGYEVVPFDQGAQLVIVNSCTVTSATDAQTRKIIRRARRLNPQTRIVVTGCYAQVDPEALVSIPGVSLVLGNEEKMDFLARLESEGAEGRIEVSDIRSESLAAVPELSRFEDRSRAFVQIQNGCDAFCSYCIIPYARGRSRSVPLEQVVEQVARLSLQGFAELVLTGIHIGGYGADLEEGSSLLELIRAILDRTDIHRLRLGSLEPTEIPDELIELVAASSRLCPHFHIPLQSGSDSVLQRMNRHYDSAFFRGRVERILELIPDAAIGLDVITGFPGETDDEFEQTRSFLDTLALSYLHVFPYSRRAGTPAASLPGQVGGALSKGRASVLRALSDQKQELYARRFIAERLEIIIEGGERTGIGRGITPNYLSVSIPADLSMVGEARQVDIQHWNGTTLEGVLVN